MAGWHHPSCTRRARIGGATCGPGSATSGASDAVFWGIRAPGQVASHGGTKIRGSTERGRNVRTRTVQNRPSEGQTHVFACAASGPSVCHCLDSMPQMPIAEAKGGTCENQNLTDSNRFSVNHKAVMEIAFNMSNDAISPNAAIGCVCLNEDFRRKIP